jgi:hypothetical protein
LRAREIEQRLSLSILPNEAFEAFRRATEASGKVVTGLARAAAQSKGRLTDAK